MEMLPREAADPEYPRDSSKAGSRNDGRNLIDEWQAGKDKTNSKYVWNLEQFKDVNPLETDNLLGLFEPSHMQFEGNRMNDVGGEPSLSEMVEKAIEILQKDKDGFFLMVEGGRIDHAHHDGLAYHALHDTIAMDKAVAKAMSMTNEMETLFIVIADHSHVLSIGGAADRGSPILGRGGLMNDGLPFTTLSYANGPEGMRLPIFTIQRLSQLIQRLMVEKTSLFTPMDQCRIFFTGYMNSTTMPTWSDMLPG
ncbi:alkaline phosphatase, tissue-nonspecific isozyme-like [Asterias amurensis]|uniref:alkaline phosphatase, tissue-nonspecific isozyme-like n=1 Tax=Asterias amurensis TaxID=7602 RepID=UPI003AB203AF